MVRYQKISTPNIQYVHTYKYTYANTQYQSLLPQTVQPHDHMRTCSVKDSESAKLLLTKCSGGLCVWVSPVCIILRQMVSVSGYNILICITVVLLSVIRSLSYQALQLFSSLALAWYCTSCTLLKRRLCVLGCV